MNIFYLNENPKIAAIEHNDKHCVKMVLEYAQMLSTAHRECDGDDRADSLSLYKRAHRNQPTVLNFIFSSPNCTWMISMCPFI